MMHEDLTQDLIGCFHRVYNELGFGLPEVVYSAALEIHLKERGIAALREHPVEVRYHGRIVGIYRVDFLVEETVILELKAGAHLVPGARAQLVTYLRISRVHVGLLLFFGPSPDVQRVVL